MAKQEISKEKESDINYKNYRKNMAYFNHLKHLFLFLLKDKVNTEGNMAQCFSVFLLKGSGQQPIRMVFGGGIQPVRTGSIEPSYRIL